MIMRRNVTGGLMKPLNMKTVDDKLKDLVKAESELEHRINEINFDYMNTVKTYVFSYIQHTHVA